MKFSDPFKILSPNERWVPNQSQMDAFQNAYEKLLPPLVYKIRLAFAKWREENYKGASAALVRLPTNRCLGSCPHELLTNNNCHYHFL